MSGEYKLDPSASFYANIIKVFEMKMAEEKNKFEYINPNMMQDILAVIYSYSENAGLGYSDKIDEIDEWVVEMFGA